MKTKYLLASSIIVFEMMGFLLKMEAVVPPPDACYPGFTTAEGCKALRSLTTGAGNTGVGWYSLFFDTTGNYNTALGAGALVLNNGDSNTATGAAALLLNSSGTENTAMGTDAMVYNDTGDDNTAVGAFSLFSNTTGVANTASGDRALFSNDEGNFNTANGFFALHDNTTGGGNTAVGASALQHNSEAGFNTAVGGNALMSNTTVGDNTAVGANALAHNMTGHGCTAVGSQAAPNSDGTSNNAFGYQALLSVTTGAYNVGIGTLAIPDVVNGSGNTAVGVGAGEGVTGEENVLLGHVAGIGVHAASNVICIGAEGENISNSCYIGQIFGALAPGGIAVTVNSVGKLGATPSSQRFKDDIRPMDTASETLFTLKPVTFRYKKELDPGSTAQFGLVAEEVDKVNPDLVVRDKEGKPYSVRYDQVNAMLLNEFLKEHCKVQEQARELEEQKARIGKLESALETILHCKTRDAETQGVSIQVQTSSNEWRAVAGKE